MISEETLKERERIKAVVEEQIEEKIEHKQANIKSTYKPRNYKRGNKYCYRSCKCLLIIFFVKKLIN